MEAGGRICYGDAMTKPTDDTPQSNAAAEEVPAWRRRAEAMAVSNGSWEKRRADKNLSQRGTKSR